MQNYGITIVLNVVNVPTNIIFSMIQVKIGTVHFTNYTKLPIINVKTQGYYHGKYSKTWFYHGKCTNKMILLWHNYGKMSQTIVLPWYMFKTQYFQKVNVQKLYYHNGTKHCGITMVHGVT